MADQEPMKRRRVIVTGGSGKAGTYVVQEFHDHGYGVLNLDLRHNDRLPVRTLRTDLTDAGQVFNALSSYVEAPGDGDTLRPQPIDAVVHLAAIPAIQIVPDSEVFRINVLSTYNILDAASKLGIRTVVFASSETTYGICFAQDIRDPVYLPLDEEYPVDPMDSYALSKVVNERTGRAFHLRNGMDAYALRIGNVIEPHRVPSTDRLVCQARGATSDCVELYRRTRSCSGMQVGGGDLRVRFPGLQCEQ